MTTPIHAYSLVEQIRYRLNDYTYDRLVELDPSAVFSNRLIHTAINKAQREIAAYINRRNPGLMMGEVNLAGANSVFALPPDFGNLLLFRDPAGRKVHKVAQDRRRLTQSTGSARLYYRKGNTLVLDRAGVSDIYSLIYRKVPRDVHNGMMQVDGSNYYLDSNHASTTLDYYNGMTLYDVTSGFDMEVTDYLAAFLFTAASGDPMDEDYYGIYPDLPAWSHQLLVERAWLDLASMPISLEKPTATDVARHQENLRLALLEFVTTDADDDVEEYFTSFEPKSGAPQLGS